MSTVRLQSFSFRRVLAVVALISVAWLASPGPALAEFHPNVRDGWLLGLRFGGGTAGVSANGASADREGGIGAGFRGGYAFHEHFSIDLDVTAWTKEQDGVTLSFGATTASLNYYPGESGLALRGGLGFGSGDASFEVGNSTVSAEESGFALSAGVAYELRLARTVALGPQVDFGWITLDSFDANWVNLGIGVTWYFIPYSR